MEPYERQSTEDDRGLNLEGAPAFDSVTIPASYYNLKVIIHNYHRSNVDIQNDAKLCLGSLLEGISFEIIQAHAFEGKWVPQTLSVEVILHTEQRAGTPISKLDQQLAEAWCHVEDDRHLWLEVDQQFPSDDSLKTAQHNITLSQMSLGTFPSTGTYNRHWASDYYNPKDQGLVYLSESSDGEEDSEDDEGGPSSIVTDAKLIAHFEHDMRSITIKHTDSSRQTWKMEIAYDDALQKLILVCTKDSTHHLYFFMKHQPKLYKTIPKKSRSSFNSDDPADQEDREVQFGSCPREVIGASNVLQMEISDREPDLKHMMLRFAKLGFSVVTANPDVFVVEENSPVASSPMFEEFTTNFGWFCLMSRGFKVTDQIRKKFLNTVTLQENLSNPLLGVAIHAVATVFDRYPIGNLQEAFEEEMRKIEEMPTAQEDDEFIIPHITKVRRILLTPTTIQGIGDDWTVENRVIREFGHDRFVRIVIRDEDRQLLSPSVGLNGPVRVVVEFLTSGLQIGDRHYRFLGCSNSQLREHGVWMYASDGKNTVTSIRRWMGDLSHERCVATYVARLGQCFSASKASVEVTNVDMIVDVKYSKYNFTDGIGKISVPLARKVSEALNMGCLPSAFQIRYAGCKGVVSCAPDLCSEEKMQIRPSMEKFKCAHNKLEVMQTTKPGLLNLNRQVIVLLSGLDVPDEAFFALQEIMLKKLADMLIVENVAAAAVCESNLGIRLQHLKESGIVVTLEPFLSSVLSVIYKQRFKELLTRTRIEISSEKGRIMMGTVDETDSLEYGEVFVRYSENMDRKKKVKKHTHVGPLFIAKNPCFHPGDLRKFIAVDKPQLYHMVDCVVFPAKGSRPHPNEMSGSDLDGDMYFVCWDESLIPPGDNKEPMDFTPQEKQLIDRNINEDDMIKFIGNYISSDQLGVIANAHLANADAQGIYAEDCLKLAQMHSDAVDFPKTGKCLRIPAQLRPVSYPHYMMKHDKPLYASKHVIGKLHDLCRAIEQSNSNNRRLLVEMDQDLILPGYEKYLESAAEIKDYYERQIGDLMTVYGVESEVELLSVTALKMKERRGYLKSDHHEVSEIIRMKLQSMKQRLKVMFFQTFGVESLAVSNEHEALRKVSALYFITYGNTEGSEENARKSLGLPWIFWDLLINIKKLKFNCVPVIDGMRQKWKSFLHKISSEVNDISKILDDEVREDRNKRLAMFDRLSSILMEKEEGAKLILFGSTLSTFDTTLSTLDIYVKTINEQPDMEGSFHKIVTTLSKEIGATLQKQFLQNSKKTVAKSIHSESNITIYFFCNNSFLQRTAYIVAALGLNKWMIPSFRVVLAWGRNNRIVGEAKECSLKSEEFILMYIYVVINIYRRGHLVTTDEINRARRLLEENHFLNCPFLQCPHVEDVASDVDNMPSLTDNLSNLSISSGNQSGSADIGDVNEESAISGNPANLSADKENSILYEREDEEVTDRRMCASVSFSDCNNSNLGVVDGESSIETNYGDLSADSVCSRCSSSTGHDTFLDVETRLGEVILQFYRHFSSMQGKAGTLLKKIPDLSSRNGKKELITLKPVQCLQIAERMIQAHHSLANSSDMYGFLYIGKSESGHFSIVLPSQVSSHIYFKIPKFISKFKASTGAEIINIRPKKFRENKRVCLVLEAWGTSLALIKVSEEVRDLMATSQIFGRTDIPFSRAIIKGAYKVLFENCNGPAAIVDLKPYRGPNQQYHDECDKQVPILRNPDTSDNYDAEQFASLFKKQLDFIKRSYDREINGELRGVISYGTFYTINSKKTEFFSKEFEDQINERSEAATVNTYSQHVNSGKQYRRQRVRGRIDYNRTPNFKKYFSGAFIPAASANLEQLYALLKEHDFIEKNCRSEYRPTVRLSVSGHNEAVLVLDEKFQFVQFFLPDEKWLVLDTIRAKTGNNAQTTDMRFKIQSRPVVKREDFKKDPDLKDLLANASSLLIRPTPTSEVFGVKAEFKKRIKFLRFKKVQEFEYRGKGMTPTSKDFLHRIQIRVNFGKEFTRPSTEGYFTRIEGRREVTVAMHIPDLNDEEECDEFIKNIWQFSKELGERLQC